ncbi:MAG: GlsB/YeaQ/YmgE family stress response membrane protein [Actinomycetota bacterium]|nr:GlsB/YeaQ/YmgE family stress response membrane protein [Actinomycetota bacterium]
MIGFIIFGLVVGAVARLLLPGDQHLSLVATLLIGLVGSVIGGVIANALGTGDIFELNVIGSIAAVIAAIVLIIVVDRTMAGRRSTI